MAYFQTQSAATSRHRLIRLYHQALRAVDGFACVRAALQARSFAGPVTVVALGKAAPRMLEAAQAVCGDQVQRALLVTKQGHAASMAAAHVELIEAGHPIPDGNSLAAGARVLAVLEQLPVDHRLLMLISGGTSSLVDVLPTGMTLDDLQHINAWLLASGLPIDAMNAVRCRFSKIKCGRLRSMVPIDRTRVLLMSDVPGDDPALIGSGLLYPPLQPRALPALPDAVRLMLERYGSAPPKADNQALDTEVVVSLTHALQALEQIAEQDGLTIHCHREHLTGDAQQTGYALATALRTAAPGLHVWGGETTVQLPERPGEGGRCQQLALAAALHLEDCPDVQLLAASTDGSDGPTQTAGACIDAATCQRGRDAGLDPQLALHRADAGRFLAASGDLIETGPTGSNVNDLVIAWKGPPP